VTAGLFATRDALDAAPRDHPAVVFELERTPCRPDELAFAWPDGRFAFVPPLDASV
jgi:hypothetical protein